MNKSHDLNTFRRTLSRRIFLRFLGAVVLYTIALFLLLGLAWLFYYTVGEQIFWFNQLAHTLFGNVTGVLAAAALALILGWVALFFYYWNRTLRYLEDLVSATETVCVTQEQVSLPEELMEVERRLNDIQRTAQKNARAAQDAEQKKNDLVVYLAHDLKTPLTSVIGYLTLLTDESGISPELRQKYLSVALDRACRLEELINEFFEITRFNLQSIPLNRESIRLSHMLFQMVEEFYPILAPAGKKALVEVPEDLILPGDPDKLARVFNNILKNAAAYSYENTDIRIRAWQEEDRIHITFSNQGPVIPPENLNAIFEKFYRLDSARSSATGGAGLGLAIAKEIVNAHQGSISAESNEEGTLFLVSLPAEAGKSS